MVINSENWVGENTPTVGSGDVLLGGAVNGFVPFSNMPVGKVHYVIVDGDNREAGVGDYSAGRVTRTTVIATLTNGVYTKNGSAISLSGNAQIYHCMNSDWARIINNLSDAADAAVLAATQAVQTANNATNQIASLDSRVQASEQSVNQAVSTANEAKQTADGVDAKAQEALDKVDQVITTGAVLLDGSLPMSGPLTIQAPGVTPKLKLKMTEVGANIIRFTDSADNTVDFGVDVNGKFVFSKSGTPATNGFFYTTDNKPTLADLGGGNITASINVDGNVTSKGIRTYGTSTSVVDEVVGTEGEDVLRLSREADGSFGIDHKKKDGTSDNWLIKGFVNASTRILETVVFAVKAKFNLEIITAEIKSAIQMRNGAGIDFQGPVNGNLFNMFVGTSTAMSNTLVITTGSGGDESQHNKLFQLNALGQLVLKSSMYSNAVDGNAETAIGFNSNSPIPSGGNFVGGLHNYSDRLAIDYWGKEVLSLNRSGEFFVKGAGRTRIDAGTDVVSILELAANSGNCRVGIFANGNSELHFGKFNASFTQTQIYGYFKPYNSEVKAQFVIDAGHTRDWSDAAYVGCYIADTSGTAGSLIAAFGAGVKIVGNYWLQHFYGMLLDTNVNISAQVLAVTDGASYVRSWKFRNDGYLLSPQESPQQWFIDAGGGIYGTVFSGTTSPASMISWCNATFAPKSDIKFKENVQPCVESALDVVEQLNFKSFDWKDTGEHEDFGLIAQELQATRPSLVNHVKTMKYDNELQQNVIDEDNSFLAYDTAANLSLALKSIQELNALVKELRQEINTLKGVNNVASTTD